MREVWGVSAAALAVAFGLSIGGGAQAQVFTDWASAVRPNSIVTAGGVSMELAYTGGYTGVTGFSAPSPTLNATFSETFNTTGDPTGFSIANGLRGVSANVAAGDSITRLGYGQLTLALAPDWTRKTVIAQPNVNGWKYQSFGVWNAGRGMAQGSMGSATFGAITGGTSVPQTGSASFGGLVSGFYYDAIGQDHLITADMGLNINFAAHAADFWTTNTFSDGRDYADLNIAGRFYSFANHPGLFGSLSTERLEGLSTAQFYGPAADEVGGVFTLTPKSKTGLERFVGAFGGTRGGYAPPPVDTPTSTFTSWAQDARPSGTVVMTGEAYVAPWQSTPTSVLGATLTTKLGADGTVTGFTAAAPGLTVAFDQTAGDSVNDLGIYQAQSPDFRRFGRFGHSGAPGAPNYKDGGAPNYNYQEFGVWQQAGDGKGNGLGVNVGAGSFGAASPGGAIPTSGSNIRFAGEGAMVYSTPDGRGSQIQSSSVLLRVDFAGRSVEFSNALYTFGPTVVNGTMTWRAGENRLTGQASNGSISGPITARFFGPAATELGGIFSLSAQPGSGSFERIVGAFASRRID